MKTLDLRIQARESWIDGIVGGIAILAVVFIFSYILPAWLQPMQCNYQIMSHVTECK